MIQRWMVLIVVLGLMPMLLAMRPVDNALLNAASKGDLGQVQALLKNEANINTANKDGETPLFSAAENGSEQRVQGVAKRERCRVLFEELSLDAERCDAVQRVGNAHRDLPRLPGRRLRRGGSSSRGRDSTGADDQHGNHRFHRIPLTDCA